MKIETTINIVDHPVTVNLSTEDIAAALAADAPGNAHEIFVAINNTAQFYHALTAEMISGMSGEQRRLIHKFLTEQAARFQ